MRILPPAIQTRGKAPIPDLLPSLCLLLDVEPLLYLRQFYSYLETRIVLRGLDVLFPMGDFREVSQV